MVFTIFVRLAFFGKHHFYRFFGDYQRAWSHERSARSGRHRGLSQRPRGPCSVPSQPDTEPEATAAHRLIPGQEDFSNGNLVIMFDGIRWIPKNHC